MSDVRDFPKEAYLDEIETWRRSARIHARNTLEQYRKVTEGLEQLHYEKKRTEEILGQLNDGVIVFDKTHQIIIFNRKAQRLFSLSASQVLEQDFDILMEAIKPDLLTFVRKQIIAPRGNDRRHILRIGAHWISARFNVVRVGSEIYYLLLLEETTDLVEMQQALEREKRKLETRVNQRTRELQQEIEKTEQAKRHAERISLLDTLTGLPNRRAFLEALDRKLQQCREDPVQSFSLLFIDLDGFKAVNDVLGHYEGDVLLVQVARQMQSHVREKDICARLGGDEFVVLLHDIRDRKQVIRIAEKLLDCISRPIRFSNEKVMGVSASIGIYLHRGEAIDSSAILNRADEAMYEAKARGKNCYALFDHGIQRRMEEKNTLIEQLDSALENREFEVHYQPICDMRGEIVGAESLGRWRHRGKMIPPGKFIPLLEQRGHIKAFTHFVIEQVFMALLQNEQLPCISINLSIQAFYDDDFIDFVDEVFEAMPSLQEKISFEITETLFHKDPQQIVRGIEALRARGFRVYIDDFGTGYSSFSYLLNFKADVVKIDRAFTIDIENNRKNFDLLKGMVALIHSMDMEVVIEGVETAAQLARIGRIDERVKIQGFHFYQPMPLGALISCLEQGRRDDPSRASSG